MIKTSAFCAALKFAAHAAAVKGVRDHLKGVLFEFTAGGLILVGSDGARLAVATLPGALPIDGAFIVSNESVKHLLALFGKDSMGEVEFRAADKGFTVNSLFGTNYTPARIDGTYPDWRRVVPPDSRGVGAMPSVDARLLAEACKALAPLCAGYKGTLPMRTLAAGPEAIKLRPVRGLAIEEISDAFVVVMPIRD